MIAALLASLLALGAVNPSQRIDTNPADSGGVMRVRTAMDHLTVIEFGEPVTMAAAGSPLFKIERQDNKVFIQPLEDGAFTNLFVWTATVRFSYELTPATSIETVHFAIDQERPQGDAPAGDAPGSVSPSPEEIAAEIVLHGTPVRAVGIDAGASDVRLIVTDVLRRDGTLFIRYTIDNRSPRPFVPSVPRVVVLDAPQSPVSLFTRRYSQVGGDAARTIRAGSRQPISGVEPAVGSAVVAPGERGSGLLRLDFVPPESSPAVLEFSFPSGTADPIAVTLIL